VVTTKEEKLSVYSEKFIRSTMKQIAGQQVALVLQPGNVWVIQKAVKDDEDTDAALKTAYMRGWVEPLEHSLPKGKLTTEGKLPSGEIFTDVGPVWRLTESGWNVINRSHNLQLIAIVIAVLSFAISVASLVVGMKVLCS
jgi:hypothetical protein